MRNPRRYPNYVVVMSFSRYEPRMSTTKWTEMLRRAGEAYSPSWEVYWERLGRGLYGLAKSEAEFYGLPDPPILAPIAQAVREALEAAGVTVEIECVL